MNIKETCIKAATSRPRHKKASENKWEELALNVQRPMWLALTIALALVVQNGVSLATTENVNEDAEMKSLVQMKKKLKATLCSQRQDSWFTLHIFCHH